MELSFPSDRIKSSVFRDVEWFLHSKGFKISDKDAERPWGGFFVIDETQSEMFINAFFPGLKPDDFQGFDKLSPKILLVAPGKRLSWQYHHRRAEIWRVIGGEAGIVLSDTDELTEPKPFREGDVISIAQGQRHRLTGANEWGVIAEIWKHTDAANPSDENDIVRVKDDFGR